MNVNVIYLLLLISINNLAIAQSAIHTQYEWSSNPAIHAMDSKLAAYPAVYIMHNRVMELRIESEAHSYFTEHKLIHINTNAGIEQFNKVYIPMHGGKELISLNVRAIDPNGKITILKKESLKELKNVEGYGNFKIFAIEGLTIGGEIEYYYTTKAAGQMYGREIFQHEIPVEEAFMEIVFPDKFTFSAKSYNGLGKPKDGVFDLSRRNIIVKGNNIPALIEEEYSAHKANLMRLDYKLESNGHAVNMVSWESFAKGFLKNTYEPSAASRVRKFLKPLNLEDLNGKDQIKAVEKYIKSNFTVKESGNDAYEDVKLVIDNHVGSDRGMVKLYMSCWEALNLSPQIVFCSNRYKGKMDPMFASPHDISDVLFYFPELNQYLTPDLTYMRLGAPPDVLAGAEGMFISYELADNKIEFAYMRFKFIEPLDYTHNDVGVNAVISFKNNLDLPEITQENFWQGYRAALYRGIYYYGQGPRRDEFVKDVTLSGIDDINLIKREVQGEDVNLSFDPENYFTIKTQYTASSLIEKAGDDYLLSVGKIIGKQSELYQEKERQMNIEFRSISDYNHKIVIELPTGYTCTGLEGIKINNELSDGKEMVMRFISDYELEGNKLTIKVNEVYKVLHVPKEKYEAFRSVINSAADFNKLVLVLHPESKY